MQQTKIFKHFCQYCFFVTLIKLIRMLPRKTGIFVMKTLASMFYWASSRHRNNTICHLTQAFGQEKTQKEIKQIARRVFQHFATVGVDVIRLPIMLQEGLDGYVKAEQTHYFEETVKKGTGAILLSGHFGNWELIGAWVVWKQYPLRVIGTPLTNPKLDQLLVEIRNLTGYVNIPRGRATRAIIKTLKEKCPLGVLMDQDTRVQGVFVDFFGKKANTPVGPILLARKFNIPIIPVFMHLEKDLSYHLEFFEPIQFANTGNPERDIIEDARNINRLYETIIKAHPEQWTWMHRRWKRQPQEPSGNPFRPIS